MRILLSVLLPLAIVPMVSAQDNFPEPGPELRLFWKLFHMPGAFDEHAIALGSFDQQRLGDIAVRSLETMAELVSQANEMRAAMAYLPRGTNAYRSVATERRDALKALSAWRDKRLLAQLRDVFLELHQYDGYRDRAGGCESVSRALQEAFKEPEKPPLPSNSADPESDHFLDIPRNHYVFEHLAQLKAAGVLVGVSARYGNRPFTIEEVRSLLRQLSTNLSDIRSRLRERPPGSLGESRLGLAKITATVLSLAEPLSVRPAFADVAKELLLEGHRWANLYVPDHIEMRKRFPDLPPKHWASGAVAEMRRLGVFVGDGDGLFHGGR